MPIPKQLKGKFWPRVRALIWEKAQQLFQEEQARTMGSNFKGITATRRELREAGYFYQAKLVILRDRKVQAHRIPLVILR